jgi:plastocyanin
MLIDERANSHIYHLRAFIMALALAGTLVLAGCDSTDANNEEPQIEALIISPSSVSIEVGEQVNFSIAALTASGDTVRDLDPRWWSSDPDVFTVDGNGTATGQAPGDAFCKAEVTAEAANTASHLKTVHSKRAKRIFVGRDSAFVSVF